MSNFLLADVGQTLCVEQAFGAAPSFVTSCCSALRVSWHLGPPYHHHHHYYHHLYHLRHLHHLHHHYYHPHFICPAGVLAP